MNAIHFGVMIVSMQKKQQQKNHQVLDLLLFFLTVLFICINLRFELMVGRVRTGA